MDVSKISWEDVRFNVFTKDEMQLLKLFHEKFIEVAESPFIKNGEFNSSFAFQIDKRNNVNTSLYAPDEAYIRSILFFVRSIAVQNDETNIRIEKMLSILKHGSANDETQAYIQTLIRNYKDRSSEPFYTLRGRFGEYNEMKIFDLWLNGYYFHNELSKREELDDLMESFPLMKHAVKDILLKVIIDSCNWAALIDDILVNTVLP